MFVPMNAIVLLTATSLHPPAYDFPGNAREICAEVLADLPALAPMSAGNLHETGLRVTRDLAFVRAEGPALIVEPGERITLGEKP